MLRVGPLERENAGSRFVESRHALRLVEGIAVGCISTEAVRKAEAAGIAVQRRGCDRQRKVSDEHCVIDHEKNVLKHAR